MDKDMVCTVCGKVIEPLTQFPDGKGGLSCLACYAKAQESEPMPTAGDIVRMWGGRA